MAYARLRSLAETAPKDVDVALNTDFFFRGSDVLLELAGGVLEPHSSRSIMLTNAQ